MRFPRIRWVLCHLGGAIPYIAERLDRGFEAFAECRTISASTQRLSKAVYYDTVNFTTESLKLAIAFAGAGHLLAGSDYPHQIGSIPKMLESLRSLDIPQANRSAIFGGNAASLLGIKNVRDY